MPPYRVNGVRTEVLRQAFVDSGISKNELCRRLDWRQPSKTNTWDTRRLNRVLGYTHQKYVKRLCSGEVVEYSSKQVNVSRAVAARIVRALELDLHDFDL